MPDFLKSLDIEQAEYEKWIGNKAHSHHTRDKKFFKTDFDENIKLKENS